ncbi:MAG: PorT family protein [Bacteroidales bacterium]|nr:PorT family protein [Bacteroidales bacterium]
MSDEIKNIDKLFKGGLRGYKHTVPVNAWSRIDEDLSRFDKRRKFFYFRLVAASLLILIAFGAGYFYGIYNVKDISDQTSPKQSDPTEVNQVNSETLQKETAQEILIPEPSTSQNIAVEPLKIQSEIALSRNIKEPKNEERTTIRLSTDEYKISYIGYITAKSLNIKFNENIDDLNVDLQDNINSEKSLVELGNKDQETFIFIPYDKEKTSKTDVKWALGAQFAPVISYRDISISYEDGQTGNINDTESQLNHAEDPLLAYAGGIDVNYNINKRWVIQSGMYYSRIGQVNNQALNFKQENNQYLLFAVNTSTGDINISFEKIPDHIKKFESQKDTIQAIGLDNIKVVQNFDLFEIPVVIKYKILNKQFGINISGGLSPAYLLNNNTILEVNSDKYNIGNSANLNSLIVNTTLALGFDYSISKKISVNFEPTFKYSLSPINNNSQFYYHPYYFSWFTGIRYKF